VLGGGSNLILSKNLPYLVLNYAGKGITTISEDSESVVLSVKAGEVWHEFVEWSVQHNLSGIENLALISGHTGASPVQNIGAYGVEVCDVIECVRAFDFSKDQWVDFTRDECEFAYRDSIFKKYENRFLITEVVFKLSKVFNPILDYGPLVKLKENTNLEVADVFNEIIAVRSAKLPDPDIIPNAGSFFKNPIVDAQQEQIIRKKHPFLVSYPHGSKFKLAAGWLIEQSGLKGRSGDDGVGCFDKQALVLVNPMRADADAVLRWAERVRFEVNKKFGVELEIEPRCW
jgi:UDP-N-acetylmuramate dehydrogenase